jgi:hypothetical protein
LGRLISLVAAPAKPPSAEPLDAVGRRVGGVGVAPPVFETDPHSTEQPDRPTTSANAPVADALPDALTDPDLARIAGAWPTLPEPVRRAMVALIAAAAPDVPGTPREAAE